MTLDEALRVAIKGLKHKEHHQVVEVKVLGVNQRDMTATVEPKIFGTNMYKVRLKGAHREQEGLEMIPAIGSTALVAIAHDNDSEPFITKTSELEKARLSIKDYEIRIEDGLLTLNKIRAEEGQSEAAGFLSDQVANETGISINPETRHEYDPTKVEQELKIDEDIITVKNIIPREGNQPLEYIVQLDPAGINLSDKTREIKLDEKQILLSDTERSITIKTEEKTIEIDDGKHQIQLSENGIAIQTGEENLTLNGDDLGLTKVDELESKLKDIQAQFNALLNDFATHVHATAAVGPPVVPTTPPTAKALNGLDSNLQHETIKYKK